MNKLATAILLMIYITSYSQTSYYTTDGKNRMTESEAKNKVSEQADKMSKALGQQLYGSLTIESTEIKEDSIIHKVIFAITGDEKENLTNFRPLSEYKNKAIPDFDLKTLGRNTYNSEQLKGKPTLINFWFTRCAPCISEMPALNAIYEEYKNDFNFISITYEQQEVVEEFLKKTDFKFTHLTDAKQYTDKLGLQAYPLNLFLDSNGIVKDIKYGIPKIRNKYGKITDGDGKEFIEILQNLK